MSAADGCGYGFATGIQRGSNTIMNDDPIDLSGYEAIDLLIRLPMPQVELGIDGKMRVRWWTGRARAGRVEAATTAKTST